MANGGMESLLNELKLTKQEQHLLRHVVGPSIPEPEPKGFWGRLLRAPFNTLARREALSAVAIVATLAVLVSYSFWKWPLVRDLLGFGGLAVGWLILLVEGDRSNRLIWKLYRALEGLSGTSSSE